MKAFKVKWKHQDSTGIRISVVRAENKFLAQKEIEKMSVFPIVVLNVSEE